MSEKCEYTAKVEGDLKFQRRDVDDVKSFDLGDSRFMMNLS